MSRRHTRLLRYARRMGYPSRCRVRWCPTCDGDPFSGPDACCACDCTGVVSSVPPSDTRDWIAFIDSLGGGWATEEDMASI